MLDNSETEHLQEGEKISERYYIRRILGSGGMGSVYLADDMMLENRPVAVKILHKDYCRDQNLTKRFLREVQLMHSVNHVNVVRTYDVGRDRDFLYFTMEFLSGKPLDNCFDSSTPDINAIVNITTQICEGLGAIHAADIVHRDLKPGNIIVVKDQLVKITDFGVARPKASELTQHNEIIGSVDYMAPEVWLGKPLTPAVDFYSLGIILYELTTGRLPFDAEQPAALMWMHVKRPPSPPASLRPEIPAWLNQFILKLLAKNPQERGKSTQELVAYLNAHAKGRRDSPTSAGSGNSGAMPAVTSGKFPSLNPSLAQSQGRLNSTASPSARSRSGVPHRKRVSEAAVHKLQAAVPLAIMAIAFAAMMVYAFSEGKAYLLNLLGY